MEEISIKRNLKRAIPKLEEISSTLELAEGVKEEALKVYNLVLQKEIAKMLSIESIAAACVYVTCRLNSVPRTLAEVSFASSIEIKEIGKIYKIIKRGLKLKIDSCDLEKFVLRFADRLDLSQKVRDEAIRYLKEVKDLEVFRGKNPIGIAASSLYLASLVYNEKKSQREFADVAGITEVTIKHGHKLIIDNLEELKNLSNTNANKIRMKQEEEEMMKPVKRRDFRAFIKRKIAKETKRNTVGNLRAFQATIDHAEGGLLAFGASEEYARGIRDCAHRLKEEIRRAKRAFK